MKLIIDIDEQHFEILQSAVKNGMGDNSQKIIANGIPLEDIRGELHSEITLLETGQTGNKLVAYGMKQALEVIDKYIERGCRDIPQKQIQEPKKEKYDNRWFNGYAN